MKKNFINCITNYSIDVSHNEGKLNLELYIPHEILLNGLPSIQDFLLDKLLLDKTGMEFKDFKIENAEYFI